MTVNPTELRANLHQLLDEVLETGVPLEIERNGRRLRIVADPPTSKLDRLGYRPGWGAPSAWSPTAPPSSTSWAQQRTAPGPATRSTA